MHDRSLGTTRLGTRFVRPPHRNGELASLRLAHRSAHSAISRACAQSHVRKSRTTWRRTPIRVSRQRGAQAGRFQPFGRPWRQNGCACWLWGLLDSFSTCRVPYLQKSWLSATTNRGFFIAKYDIIRSRSRRSLFYASSDLETGQPLRRLILQSIRAAASTEQHTPDDDDDDDDDASS